MAKKSIPLPTVTPQEATERYSLTPADFDSIKALTESAIAQARARVAADERLAAQAAPPTVTRGERVEPVKLVCDSGGKILEVPQRFGYGGSCAFIDWVNFTCHETSFKWRGQSVTDDQIIADVSAVCSRIFGFGITSKRERGMNFYRTSYVLGDGFGFVCYGGQRDTVLVQLSGVGCTVAKDGWEKRLHDFLEKSTGGRITRLDLAYDDFEGVRFNCEMLEAAYEQGGFRSGGRNPDIELRGNWKNPNGKGRTLYVGNRTNGKFFRGYEKGCQLGCSTSKWFRCEVEFKSVDRFIPFEALIYAGEYMAAAYPCLTSISQRQERILTVQKTVQCSYDRMQKWLRHQCGAALNLLLQVEGDAEKALALVVREGKTPRGLKIPSISDCGEFIHERVGERLPFDLQLAAPFN